MIAQVGVGIDWEGVSLVWAAIFGGVLILLAGVATVVLVIAPSPVTRAVVALVGLVTFVAAGTFMAGLALTGPWDWGQAFLGVFGGLVATWLVFRAAARRDIEDR